MRIVPLIVWSGVIFWFSSQQASEVSSDLQVDILIHKLAHVGVYAMLYMAAFYAFISQTKNNASAHLVSLTYCFLFACSDEIHQLFVPSRTGKISDVFIDLVGIIGSYFIIRSIIMFKNIKKILK